MLMPMFNRMMKSYLIKRTGRIDYSISHPVKTQDMTLLYLINEARNTEWGIIHKYDRIRNLNQFRAQVPVQDYESLKPYIQRMREGEPDILWPSPIRWFAKSSGTTEDRSKFIPVSKQSLTYTHYRSGKDLMAFYIRNNPSTRVFSGKCIVLSGSVSSNHPESRTFSGDISGVLIQNLEWWVNFMRAPKKQISLLPDWEEKIERIIKETHNNQQITYLSGVPSWMLVMVNKVLEYTGKKDLHEVWPQLELFVHGAVNFAPYKESFRKIITSPTMKYYESYNASEGFFAMQDDNRQGDLLLMMDYGIYYEFIPFDELGKENPRTLSLKEVELDKNYAMLISTNAGLWRYMIGDTVKFTSLNPFRILITGRTRHFINAFGEELVVENADKAIEYTTRITNSRIRDYTVAPIYQHDGLSGTHEWLIEFEQPPIDMYAFTNLLDDRLMQLNSDYEAKRKGNLALGKPIIRALPTDTFYNWMKKRGKLGGQNKVPRLANHRDYVEDILKDIDCYYNR